jgi:hypothetical protein
MHAPIYSQLLKKLPTLMDIIAERYVARVRGRKLGFMIRV